MELATLLPVTRPAIRKMANSASATKNRILATPMKVPAMPPKTEDGGDQADNKASNSQADHDRSPFEQFWNLSGERAGALAVQRHRAETSKFDAGP